MTARISPDDPDREIRRNGIDAEAWREARPFLIVLLAFAAAIIGGSWAYYGFG